MTVVAACIKNGQVAIAADSLCCTGNTKAKFLRKITKINDTYVGFAGTLTISHVIEELAEDEEFLSVYKMETRSDARDFARLIFSNLRDDFEYNNNEGMLNDHILLIATPTKIFEVDPFMTVLEHEDSAAVGSGGLVAKVAMKTVKDMSQFNSSMDTVRMAVEIACQMDVTCSLPMYAFEVKPEPPRAIKKKPVKKKPTPRKKADGKVKRTN